MIGLDNLNSYYDKTLKEKRLENISKEYSNGKNNWKFIENEILINKERFIAILKLSNL